MKRIIIKRHGSIKSVSIWFIFDNPYCFSDSQCYFYCVFAFEISILKLETLCFHRIKNSSSLIWKARANLFQEGYASGRIQIKFLHASPKYSLFIFFFLLAKLTGKFTYIYVWTYGTIFN